MRTAQTTLAVLLLLALVLSAQQPTPAAPAPQQGRPATRAPPIVTPPAAPPAVPPPVPPGVPAPIVAPALLGTRTFAAKTGLIFQSVRPQRIVDFETVIGYLKAAIEKS